MLHQIAYVSRSWEPMNPGLLSAILTISERNNRRDGLTGILMFHDQLFFQILEGERAKVERCLDRIAEDPRHTGLSLMLDQTVEERNFPTWHMAYAGPDAIGDMVRRPLGGPACDQAGEQMTIPKNQLANELARLVFLGSRV